MEQSGAGPVLTSEEALRQYLSGQTESAAEYIRAAKREAEVEVERNIESRRLQGKVIGGSYAWQLLRDGRITTEEYVSASKIHAAENVREEIERAGEVARATHTSIGQRILGLFRKQRLQ